VGAGVGLCQMMEGNDGKNLVGMEKGRVGRWPLILPDYSTLPVGVKKVTSGGTIVRCVETNQSFLSVFVRNYYPVHSASEVTTSTTTTSTTGTLPFP
jgi:hypothetical protein